jgi:two-component system sensor kinase FixL
LISNAREAMQNSAYRVMTVRSRATSADEVTVCVRDSGTGIQESVEDRLFEPLVTTKNEGMGMGLRISRSIVEEHGGRIWIENNPDAGATACFSIPVHRGGER